MRLQTSSVAVVVASAPLGQQWSRGEVVCVGTLLMLLAGLLLYGAAIHSPTMDESMHLAAGVWRWETGKCDQDIGNPPLVSLIAALPVHIYQPNTPWVRYPVGFAIGRDLEELSGARIFMMTTIARCALIPFALLGGLVCFCWSRELYGSCAGLAALILWCVDPMILAHGGLVTADIAATTCSATALYAFWKWQHAHTCGQSIATGVLLGIAQLSKFVCVILYPLFIALWLLALLRQRFATQIPEIRTCRSSPPEYQCCNSVLRGAAHLAAIFGISVWIVNIGYSFEGSFEPLGCYRFQSRRLAWLNDIVEKDRGSTARTSLICALKMFPVPLPVNYVRGVDAIARLSDQPYRETYLRRQWRNGGFWYFYLYGFVLKPPLGTLVLISLSTLVNMRGARSPGAWLDQTWLLLPIASMVAFATCTTGVQFFRYVLPVFPFLCIWVSGAARCLTLSGQSTRGMFGNSPALSHAQDRRALYKVGEVKVNALGRQVERLRGQCLVPFLVICAVCYSIGSSLSVYPHSISYINELGGGPLHGHEHFLSSEMDWGQDLLFLKSWLDGHPEAAPLHLLYRGGVDPKRAGISYYEMPAIPTSGWYAVSVTCLHGGCSHRLERSEYAYFLSLRPVAMAGFSIYIYHLDAQDEHRLRSAIAHSRRSGPDADRN